MQKKQVCEFSLTLQVQYESIYENEVMGDDPENPDYLESEEADRKVMKIYVITDDEELDITKRLSNSQIEKILFSKPQ